MLHWFTQYILHCLHFTHNTVSKRAVWQTLLVWMWRWGEHCFCLFREAIYESACTRHRIWVMCVKLSTTDVGGFVMMRTYSFNSVCNVDCSMCCTCSVYMRNGHLDTLQRPNRAVPDKGPVLKNNQFPVLNNILSVVGVFRDTLYIK